MIKGPEKCSPGVVCATAASNRIEYVDYPSIRRGRYYQLHIYSETDVRNLVRIKFCPFCGTKLILPRLKRERKKT
jgi:hypothetical protein